MEDLDISAIAANTARLIHDGVPTQRGHWPAVEAVPDSLSGKSSCLVAIGR